MNLKNILNNNKIINFLWFSIPLFAIFIKSAINKSYNNYKIYKYVYIHIVEKMNLFIAEPANYHDVNHYGPFFGLLIAPFTYLPDVVAVLLYQFVQLFALNWAIRKLPFTTFQQNIILLYLLFEAIPHAQNSQTNIFIGFVLVASYIGIKNKNYILTAVCIVSGFMVKIYGIVGLGLFFFIKDKLKFVITLTVVSIVLYLLPLLITDFKFLNQCYLDWFHSLTSKNDSNIDLNNTHQNFSAIGIIYKTLQDNTINILYILIPAFILQILPLLRYKLIHDEKFQLNYLSSLLLFVILYSTGTEASSHIIGAIGIGIWWMNQDDYSNKKLLYFIGFCFVLGTLSTTDLVPKWFNYEVIRKYSLKALPYWIVWFICIYQMILNQFSLFKIDNELNTTNNE